MDLLITIAFFIMLLSILGVLIYFVYDYLSYKEAVDKTIQMVNSSNLAIEASINENRGALGILNKNIDTQDQRNTRTELNSQTTSGDLRDFDANLRHFMQFSSNAYDLKDTIFEKRFEHDRQTEEYRLKLLKRVNAISGMTIESAPNKNLKICHAASDNCVNLSMTDSNNFDITPNTPTGMMTIKSASSSLPMAKFDFAQNNVYFGGSNIDSSPMYVSGNQVYLDKDRVKIKLTDSVNMNFNTMMTQNNRMKLAMEAMNSAIWQSSSNIEVLAQYRLTNTWASASSPITNNLQITLIPLYNIVSGTELYVELSISELGVTGITDGISMTSTPNIASVQKDVKDGNKLKITITAPSGMDKDKAIFFTLATTANKFTLVTSPTATTQNVIAGSGTTIARRNVYPADYPPILSQNAINNIYS
jgi:hypothetical protein